MKTTVGLVAWCVVAAGLIGAVPILLQLPSVEAQSGGPVKTSQVDVRDNFFDPANILVLKGTTVTWTHRGQVPHSITADTVEEFDHDPLVPPTVPARNTFQFTFEKLGKVEYHCKYHTGMVGSVTVVDKFEDPFVNVTADDNNTFNPPFVRLNESQGIVWVNAGTVNHSVTFEDLSIGDLGDIGGGESVNFTFAQNGSYRYRCTYHSSDFEVGMVGKVGVGGNATFPGVVAITSPKNDEVVNGTVNITGYVRSGIGEPPITSVEIDFDGSGNWTPVDGLEPWSFNWDTTKVENGPHLINVRGLAGTVDVASDGINVTVENVESDDGGGGIPGFGMVGVVPAFLAALWYRRRR